MLGSLLYMGGSESSLSSSGNILICVPKMNKGLTGLEQHEGKKFGLRTEFTYLGELSL